MDVCGAIHCSAKSFPLATPPTCLSLYVHGHTFPPMESFAPQVDLSPGSSQCHTTLSSDLFSLQSRL
jgi:hypothetical protein